MNSNLTSQGFIATDNDNQKCQLYNQFSCSNDCIFQNPESLNLGSSRPSEAKTARSQYLLDQEPSDYHLSGSHQVLDFFKEINAFDLPQLDSVQESSLFEDSQARHDDRSHQPSQDGASESSHVKDLYARQVRQDDDRSHQPQRSRKIKEIKYFTKNSLPRFKGVHLKYLERQLGVQFVNTFPIIQQLRLKKGIALKDYEVLYSIPQFRLSLKKMLKSKALYRDLIISKAMPGFKIAHNQIVFNFDEVYANKKFDKIGKLKEEISVPRTLVR